MSAATPSGAERLEAFTALVYRNATRSGFDTAEAADDRRATVASYAALLREHEALREDAHVVAAFVDGWWPGLEDGISWGADTDLHPAYLAAQRITAARSTTEAAP